MNMVEEKGKNIVGGEQYEDGVGEWDEDGWKGVKMVEGDSDEDSWRRMV